MTNRTPNILIVDDNPENIRVLGTILRQTNCQLTITQNGVQALEAVKEQPPDLILLDVMMPEMNGFQVCEVLKANPKTQHIEIIFITAAVATEDELKGLALGAVDYIHKPFSIPIVQAKVALHLERASHKKDLLLKNAALEENAKLRDDIERITRHDLKNPLNAILAYPELMLFDNTLSAEYREYLEEILKAGKEMLQMINNSLDLFKMETGRYQYTPQLICLISVIQGIIRDLQMLAKEHAVKIKILLDGQEYNGTQSCMVLAEVNLSYTLFANLIRNAIEACATDNTIVIAINHENKDAVISITNPGSVPEVIRDHFFEKYTTAGKKNGTGLGTYSAKLMAETQNGSIGMTTNSKETCITVRLPCPNGF